MTPKEAFAAQGLSYNQGDELEFSVTPPQQPDFPFVVFILALIKDSLDPILTFSIIFLPLSPLLSIPISIMLWIWMLGKTSFIRKRILRWFVFSLLFELIPGVSILPWTTIFVLRAHYRETKLVKQLDAAIDVIYEHHLPRGRRTRYNAANDTSE